jgi:hypothetical protein
LRPTVKRSEEKHRGTLGCQAWVSSRTCKHPKVPLCFSPDRFTGGAQGVGLFQQNVQAPQGAPVIACESQQKPPDPGSKPLAVADAGEL